MESHLNLYNHQLISVENMENLEKDKKIIFEHNIIETKIGVNADKTGYGKCLGLNTPVIMYNGDIKMVQDVDVGDLLMGDNSTPRTVLSTISGVETMYKINQSNGDSYTVNSSHILSLAVNKKTIFRFYKKKIRVLYFDTNKLKFVSKNFRYGKLSKKETLEKANNFVKTLNFPIIDIALLDYLNLPSNIRRNLKGIKAKVEKYDNWRDNYKLLFPSFLGLWFGLWLTNRFRNFEEVYEHILYTIPIYEKIPDKKEIELFCFNHNLDIDNPTFIPKPYKINNINVRTIFITKFFTICNFSILSLPRNTQLLKDIHFINNSVGFFTDLSSLKIEKLEEDIYYGFTIDGNRRFLLGDFTVTHNTLSMVSLVYNDKMSWNMDEAYCETIENLYSSSHIKEIQHKYYQRIDTTLVLASQSIVKQWTEEFKKTPLSVQLVSNKKAVDSVDAFNYDVIIVTPTMFNSYVNKYKDLAWKRFIFDEAQTVRISKMAKIVAGFIWFVSATPTDIPYFHSRSNGFMASIFRYNFDWIFTKLIIKNPDNLVEQSFAMPQTINNYYKCSDRMYNTIKGIVNDRILELISAGNIQGAIKSLGGSETSNIKELVKQKKEEDIKELEKKIEILTIQDRLNKIPAVKIEINHIKSQINELDNRFSNVLDSDCNICLDKIKNPVMEPNCQNIMCSECLLTWIKNHSTCPLCRIETDVSKFVYIKNEKDIKPITEQHVLDNMPSTKVDTVIKIIRNKPKGKIIVFSEHDQTFTPIRNILSTHNISFGEIKGTVETRDNLIQKFKNGSIQVIFLNANFNGAGINLQETTDIIVFHEMENNLLTQIVGRANRIGRTIPLNLHYLQL